MMTDNVGEPQNHSVGYTDEGFGFGAYEENTVDPGPFVLVLTILVSVAFTCMIPFFMMAADKMKECKERSCCRTKRGGKSSFPAFQVICEEQDEDEDEANVCVRSRRASRDSGKAGDQPATRNETQEFRHGDDDDDDDDDDDESFVGDLESLPPPTTNDSCPLTEGVVLAKTEEAVSSNSPTSSSHSSTLSSNTDKKEKVRQTNNAKAVERIPLTGQPLNASVPVERTASDPLATKGLKHMADSINGVETCSRITQDPLGPPARDGDRFLGVVVSKLSTYLSNFYRSKAPPGGSPIKLTQSEDGSWSSGSTKRSDNCPTSASSSTGPRGLDASEQVTDEEHLTDGEITYPNSEGIQGTGLSADATFNKEGMAYGHLPDMCGHKGHVIIVPPGVFREKDDDSSSSIASSSSDSVENADDGRRVCSKYLRVSSIRQYKFYRCDGEMRGILKLTVPYTIHTFSIHVFELMEVAVISRLLGVDALSAYVVVDFAFALSSMWMEGALLSLLTLCSQAVGSRNYTLAGQYVQIAVLYYHVLWLPFGVLWYFFLDSVVLWFGFTQEVADIARDFAEVSFVRYLFHVCLEGTAYLLEVTGYENYTAVMAVLRGLCRFIAVFLAAKNFNLTLRDVGVIQLTNEVTFTIIEILVQLYTGWLRDYWNGMLGTFGLFNRQAVRNFLKTSLPLSFGHILSYGEWEVLALFAGYMGPAEVSAWGVLGNLWESIEDISLAVADAAEVRVGNMMGSNQPDRARSVAYKSIFLGTIISVLFSIPILAMKDILPSLLTEDETLKKMLEDLIPYVCLGNIVLMFGSMCWTILGAQGRYVLATTMGFVGSWSLTLPLAALFTIDFNFDLQGLAAAIVMGYSCSGAMNAACLFTSDWKKLAKIVSTEVARGGSEVDTDDPDVSSIVDHYDDLDWDELPKHAQLAASVLGYDSTMWDKGLDPDYFNSSWDELKLEHQQAATILGYNKAKWDDE